MGHYLILFEFDVYPSAINTILTISAKQAEEMLNCNDYRVIDITRLARANDKCENDQCSQVTSE